MLLRLRIFAMTGNRGFSSHARRRTGALRNSSLVGFAAEGQG
jgi:hypothetical protein